VAIDLGQVAPPKGELLGKPEIKRRPPGREALPMEKAGRRPKKVVKGEKKSHRHMQTKREKGVGVMGRAHIGPPLH